MLRILIVLAMALNWNAASLQAQDSTKAKTTPTQPVQAVPSEKELFEKFSKDLYEVKFVGSFSIAGQNDRPMVKEEYLILNAEKSDDGDLWTITARIKYGENDLTVPMTMSVKWAGTTPVITVDQMTIPGFGTFDARVIVHDGQYAGTWRHGEVGGHLIGKIEKLTDEEIKDLKQRTGRRKKSDDTNNK